MSVSTWYQSMQFETPDLASVRSEEYEPSAGRACNRFAIEALGIMHLALSDGSPPMGDLVPLSRHPYIVGRHPARTRRGQFGVTKCRAGSSLANCSDRK